MFGEDGRHSISGELEMVPGLDSGAAILVFDNVIPDDLVLGKVFDANARVFGGLKILPRDGSNPALSQFFLFREGKSGFLKLSFCVRGATRDTAASRHLQS